MTYPRARTERRLAARQHHNQAVLRVAPAEYLTMPRNEQKKALDHARTCVVCGGPAVLTAECVRCRIDDDVDFDRRSDV